jgi:hypothetical protein
MAGVKTAYWQRLPYGLWFDPETGLEALFDRGYRTIAFRHIERPEAVMALAARPHTEAPVQVRFYNPSQGPEGSTMALQRSEKVLSHFFLGCDVRGFLVEHDERLRQANTGNFVPLNPWVRETMEDLRDRFGEGLPSVMLRALIG